MQNEAINDAGAMTGNINHQGHYAAWPYEGAQRLPAPLNAEGVMYQSLPFSMNNPQYDGAGNLVRGVQVAGQSPEWGTYVAYLWQQEASGQFTYYRLMNCVPYMRGMKLSIGEGINDSGQIICSGALNSTARAFLLTPAK